MIEAIFPFIAMLAAMVVICSALIGLRWADRHDPEKYAKKCVLVALLSLGVLGFATMLLMFDLFHQLYMLILTTR